MDADLALQAVHEVTSPQAFDGLRLAGRTVRRPDLTLATMDHNVPTENIDQPVADLVSARQMEALAAYAKIEVYPPVLCLLCAGVIVGTGDDVKVVPLGNPYKPGHSDGD